MGPTTANAPKLIIIIIIIIDVINSTTEAAANIQAVFPGPGQTVPSSLQARRMKGVGPVTLRDSRASVSTGHADLFRRSETRAQKCFHRVPFLSTTHDNRSLTVKLAAVNEAHTRGKVARSKVSTSTCTWSLASADYCRPEHRTKCRTGLKRSSTCGSSATNAQWPQPFRLHRALRWLRDPAGRASLLKVRDAGRRSHRP